MSEHEYRTEGSDRKHGPLRMIGLCSCGWRGKVVNGQDNASRADCKAQWDEHVQMAAIAIQEQTAALDESSRQRGAKL